MKKLLYSLSIALLAIGIHSCTDPEPEILGISTIEAVGTSFADGSNITKDLNGAASADGVALNSVFSITLGREMDGSSVNESNVYISSDNGDVTSSVSSNGTVITLDPSSDLQRGTTYTLNISGIKATDGGGLTATTRTFKTEGRAPVVVPKSESLIAFWNMDGSADDVLGKYNPSNVESIEFGEDRFGQGNSTASFDGDKSIIEIGNGNTLMDSDDFTLSFWMKTNSTDHLNADGNPSSQFVMGLGAFFGFQFEIPSNYNSCKLAMSYELENGDKVTEDLWFNGSGKDKDNGGWQGWDFVANLGENGVSNMIKDKWINIICSYNATEKQGTMYFNGALVKSQDFDLWPEEAPKKTVTGVSYRGTESDVEPILALGFIKSIDSPMWADTPWGDYAKPTSNHFKGDLDDIRIFNTFFSAEDAETLYNSEK